MPDKKFSLKIEERIAILSILPNQNSVVNLKVTKHIQDEVSFSEDEILKYKIADVRHPNGQVTTEWSKEGKDYTKDIMFGEIAQNIVKKALQEREQQQALHISCLGLWEKFVEVKE